MHTSKLSILEKTGSADVRELVAEVLRLREAVREHRYTALDLKLERDGARVDERTRIIVLAKARRDQYMADGWEQLADAVTNLIAEIERSASGGGR